MYPADRRTDDVFLMRDIPPLCRPNGAKVARNFFIRAQLFVLSRETFDVWVLRQILSSARILPRSWGIKDGVCVCMCIHTHISRRESRKYKSASLAKPICFHLVIARARERALLSRSGCISRLISYTECIVQKNKTKRGSAPIKYHAINVTHAHILFAL